MPGRRADQRFGKYTDTRPGPRPKKGPTQLERLNTLYRPGEVWEVHARRNYAPITKHFVLVGETPREWTKKYNHCPTVPRMRSLLRFGTPDISSMEDIDENLLYLRNGELIPSNWTVNFKFDWIAGYTEMIRAIAYEPWKGIDERQDLGILEAADVPEYGSTVDLLTPEKLGEPKPND